MKSAAIDFRRVAVRRAVGEVGKVDSLGKTLVLVGLLMAIVGAALWVWGRNDGTLLPGDIVIERKNVRVVFPIVTCLVISLVLSLVAWWLHR